MSYVYITTNNPTYITIGETQDPRKAIRNLRAVWGDIHYFRCWKSTESHDNRRVMKLMAEILEPNNLNPRVAERSSWKVKIDTVRLILAYMSMMELDGRAALVEEDLGVERYTNLSDVDLGLKRARYSSGTLA